MSTKTTFKRIALVAVAALGLGVLSVAPSSAAAISEDTHTITFAAGGTTAAATITAGESATVAVTVNVWCPATFERVGALRDTEIVDRAPATANVIVVDVVGAKPFGHASGIVGIRSKMSECCASALS